MGAHSILIVDDDSDLREFLTVLLASEGYAVFSASDEEQALSLFKANQIDLVIVGLLMPKVNGVTLLKEFKKDCSSVKSIIFSGVLSDSRIDVHRSRLNQLADRLIEKSESLLQSISELLSDSVKEP